MTVEDNKRLLQRFMRDVVDAKNLEPLNNVVARNFLHHDLAPGEQTRGQAGRDGIKQFFAGTVFPAFSNFHTSFDDLIGQSDLVAGRWKQSVAHSGPWLGRLPTHRTATIGGISIIRVRCQLIVEEWEARDTATLFSTFGIAPKPGLLPALQDAYVENLYARDTFGTATSIGPVLTGGALPVESFRSGVSGFGTRRSQSAAGIEVPALAYVTEVLNDGNLSVVDKIFPPNFTDREPLDGQKPGRDGIRQFVNHFRAAFPDAIVTPDLSFHEGDKVAVRWTVIGTNTGTFLGRPPTRRRVKVTGINVCRVRNALITDKWGFWPTAEIFQQLDR
jgi:predicted ester cyclase